MPPPPNICKAVDTQKRNVKLFWGGLNVSHLITITKIQFRVGYEAPDLYCAALSGAVVDGYDAVVEWWLAGENRRKSWKNTP
jgi:hypothetical protein